MTAPILLHKIISNKYFYLSIKLMHRVYSPFIYFRFKIDKVNLIGKNKYSGFKLSYLGWTIISIGAIHE